jgi:type IV pilus assembly protein PilO
MELPAFLVTAPRWQKLVLGVIGLAALGGAGYFFVVFPLERRVAALRTQRDSPQGEVARTRALAADLARLRREAVELEREIEVAKERLPSDREMPSLYRTLSDAAGQAGLAVTLFQPRAPVVRDFYSEIPISLVAEGGYHEVGDLFGRVAALPRTTTIGEFKLTGMPPEASRPTPSRAPGAAPAAADAAKKLRHALRAEITLLTFVYRPVGSPPAPKPGAAKPEASKP